MAFERRQTPREEELRRRAARLDERERRLAVREREVAAREAELRCGDVDRRLRKEIFGERTAARRTRALMAAGRAGLVVAALWLMLFPLVFPDERGPVLAAAVIAGAVLGLMALVRARLAALVGVADIGLGGAGTWLLAWAGLGHATSAGGWALALTGVLVWATALAGSRR
jgi:hypothetical protein